jgi:hypothetical protein
MYQNGIIVLGIIVFFLLEKFTQMYLGGDSHSHSHTHEEEKPLVVKGDKK